MTDAVMPCHWTHRHGAHDWTPLVADPEQPRVAAADELHAHLLLGHVLGGLSVQPQHIAQKCQRLGQGRGRNAHMIELAA